MGESFFFGNAKKLQKLHGRLQGNIFGNIGVGDEKITFSCSVFMGEHMFKLTTKTTRQT